MIKKHGGNVHAYSKNTGRAIGDIIDFSANINPLGMSKKIKPCLDEILDQALHYPDPDYKGLLEAIGRHEGVKDAQIVLGNGAIECIFLLAEHLEKKHLHIQAPTFVEYERAFKKYGCQVTYDYLNHETFSNTGQEIIEGMPEGVDVMVICNPNNPTGTLMAKDQMIYLLEATKRKKITLIVDEAFIDFSKDEAAFSIVDQLEKYDHLIILKSLTKFYGMPGLRLGYFLSDKLTFVEGVKNNRMPWAINSIVEQAGILSLGDTAYIQATKDFVNKERTWLKAALEVHEGLQVFDSQGNYLFFKSQDKALKEKLEDRGLMIRSCENYEGLGPGYYRVAVKTRQNNAHLIKCLKDILSL